MRRMRICLVAVNYNSYDLLYEYANSVAASLGNSAVELDFAVVDNSTVEKPCNVLKKISSLFNENYHYFESENIGYFPAFSYALKKFDISKYDFVIVSNVDLRLSVNFFSELTSLSLDDSIGVVAPAIFSEYRQADLNPKILNRVRKRDLKRNMHIFSLPVLFYLYNRLSVIKAKRKRNNFFSGEYLYAPHGSMIIFTKSYFDYGGRVDYPRFLFGEEVFVGEECLRLDKKVVYKPELTVFDRDHASTSLESTRFISKEHVKSLKYLINEYFS
jgi:GT2 family glycosyltransferase